MKNSYIRRSVSGVLAMAMICSAYSCSKNDNSPKKDSDTQNVQTANEVIENAYSSIEIETEIPLDYVDQVFYVNDSGKVIISGNVKDKNMIYMSDTDFTDFREIKFDFEVPENSQYYTRLTVSPDGTIYALVTLIDYGSFKLPDYDDPDFDYENFDYDAMNAAARYKCTLYTIDMNGEIISENELSNLEKCGMESEEDSVHIRDISSCPDGTLIVSFSGEEEIHCTMTAEGEITGKISNADAISWVNCFGNDSEGNVICSGYGNDGLKIFKVNIDSKKFEESNIDIENMNDMVDRISTGMGEYNLFMTTQSGLYGADSDGKVSEVINWLDSDIKGYSVQSTIALEDGDFIIYYNDYQTSKSGFCRLTKRDPEEFANQSIINVAVIYSDTIIMENVANFNKEHTDCRIKLLDYSQYDQWDNEKQTATNTAMKQLRLDILSGKTPDMIVTYDNSIISELAPKGLYTNLYTYLENDEELSKDDIMPNVLKASEIDGKLFSLAPYFGVVSMACKSKYCDKENWTFDDMFETYAKYPDMQFTNYGNTKEEVFEFLLYSMDTFIDYKKSTCDFNTETFKKVLEFCNKFPDKSEEIDWYTATDEEMNEYFDEQSIALRNDKALLGNIYMYDLIVYSEATNVDFGEDITLVGIPSEDGKGSFIMLNNAFAIMEDSPSKDMCWEFLKSFFNEETYDSNMNMGSGGLPSYVPSFEKAADASMEKPFYLDSDGNKVEYERKYYIGNEEFEIKPLTKKERDFAVDYVKKAERVYGGYPDEIHEIITAEVTKYFKGECTSQQAIDMIQNRVSLFLSEQS